MDEKQKLMEDLKRAHEKKDARKIDSITKILVSKGMATVQQVRDELYNIVKTDLNQESTSHMDLEKGFFESERKFEKRSNMAMEKAAEASQQIEEIGNYEKTAMDTRQLEAFYSMLSAKAPLSIFEGLREKLLTPQNLVEGQRITREDLQNSQVGTGNTNLEVGLLLNLAFGRDTGSGNTRFRVEQYLANETDWLHIQPAAAAGVDVTVNFFVDELNAYIAKQQKLAQQQERER